MKNSQNIYSKNLFFILFIFIISLCIPYAKSNPFKITLFLGSLSLYAYMFIILLNVIKRVSDPRISINELKFLFITIAAFYSGCYFFLATIDQKEIMISGIREVNASLNYDFYSFTGFYDYAKDIFITYLNCVYYSVMIMATLGDSNIEASGGIAKLLVASEVGLTLTITIFKVGEYYSLRSSQEALEMEKNIIRRIDSINRPSLTLKEKIFRVIFKQSR
ncbi:hypothetical protein IW01_10170 [Pectobacterium brasiliense]|uniref:hypothetical protein n=1 Tax=Pectobacterium brasiliense TaxID=180957 RepID=UPI0004E6B3F4|nr:hypothetical protein [Pectobacterium brasiliense]KFF70513.1 hypothetical protein IW01_10170 [Pectobacterium brasiliense]